MQRSRPAGEPDRPDVPKQTGTGILFRDRTVAIDLRATGMGGAWQGPVREGMPTSWDSALVEFVFNRLMRVPDPILVDVGANTGTFSLLAVLHPELRCVAIEPSPLVCDVLRSNVALNDLADQVTVLCTAVSDKQGHATLRTPTSGRESGLANIGVPKRFNAWTEDVVQVDTLDNILDACGVVPSLIKIDTEGCELLVLRGARRAIRSSLPELVLEVSSRNARQFGYDAVEIFRLLESWGYLGFEVGPEDAFFVHSSKIDDAQVSSLGLRRIRKPHDAIAPGRMKSLLQRLRRSLKGNDLAGS